MCSLRLVRKMVMVVLLGSALLPAPAAVAQDPRVEERIRAQALEQAAKENDLAAVRARQAAVDAEADAARAKRSAAQLLPGTSFFYAELTDPAKLAALVADHPVLKRLEEHEQLGQVLAGPQARHARMLLRMVEEKVGLQWQPLLQAVAGGGVYAVADVKTQGGALLVRSSDRAILKTTFDYLLEMAKKRADREKGPEVEKSEYRDRTLYQIGEQHFGLLDDWFIVANKKELAHAIVDNFLKEAAAPLAEHAQFVEARDAQERSASKATAWAYLDLSVVRLIPGMSKLSAAKTEDPGQEILVGGVVANLAKTPYASASLHFDRDALKLSIETPHKSEWVGDTRAYFFQAEDADAPQSVTLPDDALFSLDTHRDFAAFWTAAGEMFDENVATQMAQTESLFSTLFSGRDFVTEVLAELDPNVQLVAKRQEYDPSAPVPAIKVPAFAAIFTLKNPETMSGEFKRIYQSLVGFLNIVGAMEGNPQLDFKTVTDDGRVRVLTEYVVEPRDQGSTEAPIIYNFSPSIALVGDKFILSSTSGLATELAELADQKSDDASASNSSNTSSTIDVQQLATVLHDNRQQLVSQNMLEKGHSKEQAEGEIDVLLTLLGELQRFYFDLSTPNDALRLEVGVEFKVQ